MRASTILVLAVIGVLALGIFATAENNKYGVADVQKITFSGPVRIGNSVLPAGEYEVRHNMEGENHIMVFRQLDTAKPAEASVRGSLVLLKQKASRTEKTYVLNAANEQVLLELVFRGDMGSTCSSQPDRLANDWPAWLTNRGQVCGFSLRPHCRWCGLRLGAGKGSTIGGPSRK